MVKITFLATNGCYFSNISGLIDSFTIANQWHAFLAGDENARLFATEIVTVGGRPITASGGIRIVPHRAMEDVDATDIVQLPAHPPVKQPCTDHLREHLDWAIAQYRRKAKLAAVCTAVFFLAETGLLDGRVATTNWVYAKLFKRRFPAVRLRFERIVTEEDGLICAGASTASFNMAFHILQTYAYENLAAVWAKSLLVDLKRDCQTPYVVFDTSKSHGDAAIVKAQQYLESNYARGVKMDALARHTGLSPRHFNRRFKQATGETPLTYLQHVRMEVAKNRLETTSDGIDEIAGRLGYENSCTFRRLFKHTVGISPREYRDKFSFFQESGPVLRACGRPR